MRGVNPLRRAGNRTLDELGVATRYREKGFD
jgi:hypothetical protein